MKKLFLAIAIMATSFVFAENVLSLNVSPLGTKITNGEFRDRNIDSEIREYHLSLSPEYNYIFDNNFLIGAMLGLDICITADGRNGETVLATVAPELSFAPIVGMRFGKRNLFTAEFLPVKFGFKYINNATKIVEIDDELYKTDIDYDATDFSIKSGLQMNFQWGSRLCRNGFFAGIYIPWYRKISNASLGGIAIKDMDSFTIGVDFSVGYRLSFVM